MLFKRGAGDSSGTSSFQPLLSVTGIRLDKRVAADRVVGNREDLEIGIIGGLVIPPVGFHELVPAQQVGTAAAFAEKLDTNPFCPADEVILEQLRAGRR